MSLAVLANHMASKGRDGDSMLVHMSPQEVAGLHALAVMHGEKLTINPETGLLEASRLKSLLPMIAGMALNAFLPGVGTAIGTALGGLSGAVGTGILVGGVTGLATGSLQKGIMAGLGAYGGASLAQGLVGASSAGATGAAADMATRAAGEAAGLGLEGEAANQFIQSRVADAYSSFAAKPMLEQAAGSFGALKDAGALSSLARPAMYAAAPVMADAMVPTTTKMPTSQPGDTGYVRSFIDYNPLTHRVTPLPAVPANAYRFPAPAPAPAPAPTYPPPDGGYASGGITSFARGGYARGGIAMLAGGGFLLSPEFTAAQYQQMAKNDPSYAGALEMAKRQEADPYLKALRDYALGRKYETLVKQGMDDSQILQQLESQRTEMLNRAAEAKQLGATDIDDATGLRKVDAPWASMFGKNADLQAYLDQAKQNYAAYQEARPQIRQLEIDHRNRLRSEAPPPATGGGITTLPGAGTGTGTGTITGGTVTGGNVVTTPTSTQSTFTLPTDQRTFDTTPGNVTGGNVTGGGVNTSTTSTTPTFTGPSTVQTPTGSVTGGTVTGGGVNTFNTTTTPTFTGPDTFQTPTATVTGGNVTGTVDTKTALDEYNKTAPTGRPLDVTSAGTLTGTKIAGNTFGGVMTPEQFRAYIYQGGANDAEATRRGLQYITSQQGFNPESATNYWNNALGTKFTTADYARVMKDFGFDPDFWKKRNQNAELGTAGKGAIGTQTMQQIRDEYTKGGGSLGMPDFKFEGAKLTGGSKSAYDYLMGQGPYPTNPYLPPNTPVARPYSDFAASSGRPSGPQITLPRTPTRQEALNTTGGNNNTTTGGSAGVNTGMQTWVNDNTGERRIVPVGGTIPDDNDGKWRVLPETNPFASGGAVALAGGGQYNLGGYSDGGRLLRGPGDGVSDSIPATIGNRQPARLADGEFVIPARIVSEIGNGSTEAGARKLYAMMDRVQRARAKTTGKGKVARDTRADKYLPA